MQQKIEKKSSNGDLSTIENFLLTNDISQKAFANLSKNKNTIEKEELLDETKRLIKEQIMEQIRQNQIELKKHRL